MLCKHFDTTKGCAFGDKCQFAHGLHELRPQTGTGMINVNIKIN